MSLKTLYRKRTVIWPFYFYTIIRTLSVLLLVAYLILVKKFYFFSNLIPKNTTDINLGKKYGTASGIGSLVIGIILIILGLFL
nr:hypothetical protein [Enterococcus faecalis]